MISLFTGSLVLGLLFTNPAVAQQIMPLYSGKIPNAKQVPDKEYADRFGSIYKVSKPTLYMYQPPAGTANGTAVVICPGGGYHNLVIDWEGYKVAKRLTDLGITAFILKYRLPSDSTLVDKSIGPLQDAQQAIRLVRMNAAKWHIDTSKVGIMGFSAGGHVASTEGTHFEQPLIDDPEGTRLRPDFMILVYPVISMEADITHMGSRRNLLGPHPSQSAITRFSNDLQVTSRTPPAFIVQAEDDSVVSVQNSIRFFQAMYQHKVSASLHIYQEGGHGFVRKPPRDVWMKDLVYWMKDNHWLP